MRGIRIFVYAWNVFRSVRRNDKDGFSMCRDIRFVCRYHCLVKYHDWDVRYKFQAPSSREEFINACIECSNELVYVSRNGLLDRAEHYWKCQHTLRVLKILCNRFPLIWHLAYKLPI